MATSNGHKSETTSSITTKRGKGTGSVEFSEVILLKILYRQNLKPEKGAIFTKKVETVPLTYMFGQRYQQVGNRVMSKYFLRNYMQALHWQVTVD